jgi:pimeloyl-ACP methyl ester carboxylesterase
MNKLYLLLVLVLIIGCLSDGPVDEKIFIDLDGEPQYIEMKGGSKDLPVLLFLHGGPGWPQTPHLRYFNSDLTDEMILISWDQAGSGQSYMRNPNPKKLSTESLIANAHELTQYLKTKFNQDKIYLLGFSYGSVLGLQLADRYPNDYYAYIGVSQLIDHQENWDISMQWIKEQATAQNDTATLRTWQLIDNRDPSVCQTEQDCFMSKYQLLVKYNGTIYKKEMADEIAKAESFYPDYKSYEWYEAYNYTSSRLGGEQFNIDLTHIDSIEIPVYFMAGRHDWNLPGIVAENYLSQLTAPKKEFIWFDYSGHEPPEEEAELFNTIVKDIVRAGQ